MKPIVMIGLALLLALPCRVRAVDETDPAAILKRTLATYETMRSYRARGNVVSHFRALGRETTSETRFTLALGRPHLYRVTWSKLDGLPVRGKRKRRVGTGSPASIDGAAWNAGSGPFNYEAQLGAYAKAQNDEMALAAATGVSGGAAHTIPALFFKDSTRMLAELTDLELRGAEKVDGEDCYVMTGKSRVFRAHVLWISKSRFVILKHQHSHQKPLEAARPGPKGLDSFADLPEREQEEALKQGLAAMGLPDTPEARARLKGFMDFAQAAAKLGDAGVASEGETIETYGDVVVDGPSEVGDYEFRVPEGTALKKSLMGTILGVEEP